MGYVYSPRQVKAGEFPSSNDVKTAFDMAKDELWVLHRSGYLLGAKMHGGSFNNSGECLVGGDIDVIAVTSSIEANSHLANIYRMIKKKKKVPLEIVPYP
ncbi:MAG: hypothetical protein NT129_02060, partial [Candidatus Aenigmarchaeota archaeon]|nr:hypothetical protein [Candidatus Aenigmarchaeota archaeon]